MHHVHFQNYRSDHLKPHLLPLVFHIFFSGVRIFLAMAIADCDLDQYVRERETLDEHEAKYITAQTLNGIKYLHDIKVAHRDLKVNSRTTDDISSIES